MSAPIPPDIEIAQAAKLKPIEEVASKLGLGRDDLLHYGPYKAKINEDVLERSRNRERGKLILVTGMTATRAGDGKTVTSTGLAQGLGHLGKSHALCLREPSLGPTLGIKGGAAGGGYAQVVPMEDINLHFTGDLHAITTAHNVLAAVVDNHAHFELPPAADRSRITWRRVIDLCDRQLRKCEVGRGGQAHGFVHETGFDITAASEIMAVMALSKDRADLRARLERMVVAYDSSGKPITAKEYDAIGALEVLLKDAFLPNLVQTLEHTPAFVHCGPFANIAHGCNSVVATTLGQQLADYVVTEAGFAADLGGEKFMHIKCRQLGHMPAAAVLVLSIRALKLHGESDTKGEDLEAVRRGFANAAHHIASLKKFGVPVVAAINRFAHDTQAELDLVRELCEANDCRYAVSEVFARGGEGGAELATAVLEAAEGGNQPLRPLYELNQPLRTKIETIAREIYGADGVDYEPEAEASLDNLENHGFAELPVCMAKTQLSISDNPKLVAAPKGWRLKVRDAKVSAGAGFVVIKTGKILLMPGMPRDSAAARLGIDGDGKVFGLS